MVGDEDAAREVVQDVWIRVLRGIPKLRDGSKLRAWLFGIARRTMMDRLRERYASPIETEIDLGEVPAETWSSDEEHELQQLEGALARLPTVERDVLTLFYLEDLTLADIAEALRVPVERSNRVSFAPDGCCAKRCTQEFHKHEHHTPPPALAGELRRLTVLELSRSARAGYVCLLLGARR